VLHRAVVHTGAIVGAGAVVRNGMEVPANAMALGVPAVLKLMRAVKTRPVASAALYVANARRYRTELRRIKRWR